MWTNEETETWFIKSMKDSETIPRIVKIYPKGSKVTQKKIEDWYMILSKKNKANARFRGKWLYLNLTRINFWS